MSSGPMLPLGEEEGRRPFKIHGRKKGRIYRRCWDGTTPPSVPTATPEPFLVVLRFQETCYSYTMVMLCT